jgi:hypothetical protein
MANLRTPAVKVTIVGWYENYPPGIVECSLRDRFAKDWRVTVKQYDATGVDLNASSSYPLPGLIDCLIVSRGIDEFGKDTVIIEPEPPLVNLTEGGIDRFDIFADQLA